MTRRVQVSVGSVGPRMLSVARMATVAVLGWLFGGGAFVAQTCAADAGPIAIHKRWQEAQGEKWEAKSSTESWAPQQSALIVCDVWDSHHCLNAVRRVEEMVPRMNQVLRAARARGVLIIHAPSSCMAAYEGHPARLRAQQAPAAANLPTDIGEWCRKIPAEGKVIYPVDQSDGGEDDDPAEHLAWRARLGGSGRTHK